MRLLPMHNLYRLPGGTARISPDWLVVDLDYWLHLPVEFDDRIGFCVDVISASAFCREE